MLLRLSLLLAGWLCVGVLLADTRLIRLRTETIETPDRPARTARPAVGDDLPVSGLFLLQLTNHCEGSWRSELAGQGVEFLNYIPDEAFLVRLEGAHLGAIRALPYVRWVGAYELRHKLHPQVMQALAASPGSNLPVKFLVRPGASPAELAFVRLRVPAARLHTSPAFGTFVTGNVSARQLSELARSPAVLWIEKAPRMKLVDEIAAKIVGGKTDRPGTFARVHQQGFDGRGVTVSVADSGLDLGNAGLMHPDLAGRVDAFFFYDNLPDGSDEHSHGTHCAGIVAGNAATGGADEGGNLYGLGVAPGSHLVAQRIFDAQGGYRPPESYERLTRDAVRAGAYVGSNSWGDDTQGQYDLSAAEFDALVRDADALTPGDQPYVLEFSAGNAGPGTRTIGSPAVAKNVIATGASQNERFTFGIYAEGREAMADFSSRGPCEDGRIKPDVTAPGTWISSLKSRAAGDQNSWSPIDANYLYMGGTSQAGPHASGACAVIIQWYRSTHAGATPSPALVKAALINSAEDMGTAVVPGDPADPLGPRVVVGGTGPVPNQDEGWGRISLENLIDSDRRYQLTDQGVELLSGQVWEKRLVVGAAQPLKITLVYTDVPGLPAALPALVNDLDLEAVAPNGSVYRGNAFANGDSMSNTPEGDNRNNVEAVHLALPLAGEWIVRVRARNVVQDIHRRATGLPVQDFALVISGSLPAPGEGVVAWDRAAYQVPSVATVRVVDDGLRTQSTVGVRITSPARPEGLTLTLTQVGASSSFTGAVQLVTGAAGAGQFTVTDGDQITAVYVDASPAGERRTTARVDNRPPVIAGVVSTARFGRVIVSATVSEPAAVSLFYGTTNAVNHVISTPGGSLQPEFRLPLLEPGVTYFYYLVATDQAGNVSTNKNDGHYFRVVGPKAATALLVYSPEQIFTELFPESPYPGPENWTQALDALGIDYEVWNTKEKGGVPTADQLKAYRLVLWRPEELQALPPGITTALTAYVAQGGALFVASFDLLSRLSEANQTAFATNILKVVSEQVDQGAVSIGSVRGDPVGSGAQLDLDYSAFPKGDFINALGIHWEKGPDHLQIGAHAAPVFVQENGRVVGLRSPRTGVDSVGRVVFLSIAFEAIPAGGPAPNNRATILGSAVGFLVPGLRGLSTVSFSSDAFTVPGSVTLEVSDPRRAGSNTVSVAVTTTTAPALVRVDCFETPIRGVFRGRFVLVAPNPAALTSDPPAPPPGIRVPARNRDLLTATYVDAAGRSVLGDAVVDTLAPVLSLPTVDPAYNEVGVTWTTDKATDALVQFGESGGDGSFLTRTAYVAERGTAHEVLVRGLIPDRAYNYQIVSRDAAGNATTDNKGGKLYQFRTLKPLSPPWRDDLENGRTGWAVYDQSGSAGLGGVGRGSAAPGGLSGSNWAYGRPANTHGVTAHSGEKCWGTNLGGEAVDLAITDLISPAISLVGGNKATLRFWQNYDFSLPVTAGGDPFGDLTIEAAQLEVSADNGATWSPLYANPEVTSGGWQEVTLNLSKYLGKVVRFRFNYQLFSFSATGRLGWLIDDLAVDVVVVAETGLVVSNNLSQATFTLASQTRTNRYLGFGLAWRTNLPPDTYSVRWDAVRYYDTPASQTNVLGNSTNRLEFTGTYTYPDVNGNGISDLWEKHFFGGLLGTAPTADADGDGASNRSEFLAGTDPVSAGSVLKLSLPLEQPNRTVRLEWPTVGGREYTLEGSQDLRTWQGYSGPARGDGKTMSVTLPALDPRLTYLFRLRVVP